jgi:hypothetical protein
MAVGFGDGGLAAAGCGCEVLAVGCWVFTPRRRRRLDFQTLRPHVLPVQRRAVASGVLAPAAARSSLVSWNAHLAHGHTWRLRRRLFAGLPYAADLP